MLVKFKIASFRETDRVVESIPMFLTHSGLKSGNVKKEKVWDYELTDTNGKTWTAYHKRVRGGFRKGQVVMTELQGSNNQWIGKLLTQAEFIKRAGQIIDQRKSRIKIDEAEIERVRAL